MFWKKYRQVWSQSIFGQKVQKFLSKFDAFFERFEPRIFELFGRQKFPSYEYPLSKHKKHINR